MKEIFIEAESFENRGGWYVDTASMESLHSAYLMAHGIGVPVEDAKTHFSVEDEGEYYVWALTRDWTAVWGVKNSAGKFKIKINGTPLKATLGTNGAAWDWQLAGKAHLNSGKNEIALSDLTGFNARCDAIYITDSETRPDASQKTIDEMRARLNYKEICDTDTTFDLVVVGGGIAGTCMALSAYRSGVSVALINDRPMLGGCNSSEIRVALGGQMNFAPYEKLGNLVREIGPVMGHPTLYKEEYYEDKRKEFAFQVSFREKPVYKIFQNECASGVEAENGRISAVICTNALSGKKTRIRGHLFADCSGDGICARLGGAEVMYGTEARDTFGETLAPEVASRQVMGHSIRWYSEDDGNPSAFQDLDWNLSFDEDTYLNALCGDWEQETGFLRDMVSEIEYIRDYGLRAIYSNWSYQKNHAKEKEKFANYKIKWVSPSGGKRESYRVVGDYVLTQRDLEENIVHEDGTAKTSWGIDIHYPDPTNADLFGEAFRSFAYHRSIPEAYAVPYRTLYSKDIENLFLGGRLISASHVAFSSTRVMRTLGMLGEVVGLAASICKEYGCTPRGVYENHLDKLKELMAAGANQPFAFPGGGVGCGESYHFKDIGWWITDSGKCQDNAHKPKVLTENEIQKFEHCVNALGIKNKYPGPKNWK